MLGGEIVNVLYEVSNESFFSDDVKVDIDDGNNVEIEIFKFLEWFRVCI